MATVLGGGSSFAILQREQNIASKATIYSKNNNAIESTGLDCKIARQHTQTPEDVCIFSEDSEKTDIVKQGLAICKQNGFIADKMDIFITEDTDRELGGVNKANKVTVGQQERLWTNTGKRSKIIMRKQMPQGCISGNDAKDWLANISAKLDPVWGEKTYSGRPYHCFLHELGHHFHTLAIENKLNRHLFLDRKWIMSKFGRDFAKLLHNEKLERISQYLEKRLELLNQNKHKQVTPEMQSEHTKVIELADKILALSLPELTSEEVEIIARDLSGDDYFATNAYEAIAEMFARLVGGKKLSEDLAKIYEKYHGPISPLLRV